MKRNYGEFREQNDQSQYIYVNTHNTGYITTKIRIQTIYMLKC